MLHVHEQGAVAATPRVKEIVFHVTCALIASHGLAPDLAWALDAVVDGRTDTRITQQGVANVFDISTNTRLGNGNALNSFSRFNVGSGEIANLHVPLDAPALINLVRDQKTTVAGMLNAVKDGKIGGKIYFANPHGFVVSSSGVVNVGSLHVSTPTQQFVDDFFDAPGGADASAARLVAGTAPRNTASRIDIEGRINATEQASLSAGTITVAGKVFTGAKFTGTSPAFQDVVNIQGLDAGAALQANQGRIEIVGDAAIAVSGTLSSRRVAENQSPELLAEPSIAASGDIALDAPRITISGGKVLAAGSNGHAGGDVGLNAHAAGGSPDALSDTMARIALTDATLTGKDLTLNAQAAHDSSLAPVVSKTVSASVSIDSSTLTASGAATVDARSSADISTPDFVPFATLDVDVAATVAVSGNSRLGSAADTQLSATTTSNLEAHPGLPDFGAQPGDAGVAIVIHNSTATVDVAGTSEVGSSSGRTDLAATNVSLIDAEVDASATGESAVGGAVATSVLNSTTRARVADNAKLSGKTGVGVVAQSVTLARTVARAAAGGATELGEDESKTEETLATYQDEAATSDGSVAFAAAVAVSDIDSSTLAALDSAQTLHSEGGLTLSSTALTQSDVVADGSSAGGSVGVGVGVALNLARLNNEARIAQPVDTVGVNVKATLPDGDEINLFSTAATAGAGANDVGVAGALAVNVLDNASAAHIAGSGRVNAGNGRVSIRAENRSESNASATPAGDATVSGETLGVGAAVAINVIANTSRAQLANGATLDGTGTLGLEALGEYAARTEAEAGAEGGIAATPVAAVAVIDNNTQATIGTGTPIRVGGEVRVEALQASTSETSAKASAAGEKAALGIAVGVNVINETVSASIHRNVDANGDIHLAAYSAHLSSTTATASAKGGKGEEEGGEEEGEDSAEDDVDQEIGRQTQFAQGKQKDDSESKTQEPDSAETSEGKISVAAAVAVNSARTSTTASIADGVELAASGALSVEASGNADASADADGSAAGSTTTVGIGAAVAVNSVRSATEAWIGNAKVSADGIAVRALMTDLGGDSENTFSATAKAGAGAGKVGIAGALALNILDTRSTAEIHGGALIDAEGGELELRAESESVTTATALPDEPASGGKLGVGASVALNLFREEEVRARIRNGAELIDLDKLSVIANARSDTTAEAEAGAEGGVALDSVVALSELKLQTEALVEAGAAISTTGAVNITATSAGEHVATASGDTESSKVGIGASGAIILSTTQTRASLERDLTTTGTDEDGALTVRAESSRSYEAVATASAAGGKAEDETTEAERDKAASTSTLKDNKDAQEGTETTKKDNKLAIAAAVGAAVLDDDTRATIGAGRTLELGGRLAVEASSDSDFSARGLGNTLDIDKLQDSAKVGIGVGVGLAIARNDTEASIGADSTIVKASAIDIAAEASQNTAADFANKLAAEGIAGAGAEKVGIAGALAVAYSQSSTKAWLGDRTKLGDPATVGDIGAVSISADNTSKLSAKAWSAALAGKVGIGASIAILRSDNAYRAWVGDHAEITAASLNLAARNHVITGAPPFDWSVLTDLENRFTETNLQILLGQNNYYTETIAGAGSNKVAVTGAFSVNVFEDLTEASIGTATKITATNAVTVEADNSTTAKAFAGGIAAAGKVGVGLASADIVNESMTRASIGIDARIEDSSAIDIDAAATMDLAVISASAGAAGTAGASGVLSLIDSKNAVEAFAGDGSVLRSRGNIGIVASNTFEALGVAGVAGIGGTAGVGVSAGTFLIDNRSEAWTGDAADLAAAGLIQVGATSTQDLTSVVVGGAGGGTAGVAASAAVNVYKPITQAWIGDNGRVNADISDANLTGRTLRVSADSITELLSIVGTVGIGGTAGVGGAADVVVLTKKTAAWVGEGVIARTGASLELLASSTEKIRSAGVGLSAGGTAGVQGSASVLVLDIDTLASAAAGSSLFSGGNLVIAAESSGDLDLLSGAIGAAGSAAVGAAATVAVVDKTTHAWVDDGAAVTALGRADATQVASGRFNVDYSGSTAGEGEVAAPGITPSNGENDLAGGSGALDGARQSASATRAHRGLAVTAVNQDDIKGYAVTGAASGTAAVTLSGDVAVHTTDTQASIGSIGLEADAVRSGVRVNADNTNADAAQSVLVAAGNDSFHLGIAGALSASGTVGVGIGADVAVTRHQTQASISDHSTVNATRDVEVSANSTQEVVSVSASLGASGTVGVSGSVSVLGFDNTTWASIGDDAVVDAGGNVAVKADDSTSTTLVAGTVALGLGGGGIGGGVGITLIDKDTRAWIGDNARVDGRGQNTTDLVGYSGDSTDATTRLRGVQVQAQSSEDLFTVSAAAAGGLYLGFAGAVSVATVDADTLAWIGNGAQVNKGAGDAHASQDVNVTARNDFSLFNVSGALGVGAAGIAGGVDVGVIRNDTTAFIGDEAQVAAARDIDVNALARKEVESTVVSAAGGLGALAGGVGVYSVGGALGDDAQHRLETDDGDAGSYADGQATDGSIGDVLDGYDDEHIGDAAQRVQTERGSTAASSRFTVTENRELPAGTAAFIGQRAQIDSGGNIDVDARERVTFDMRNGGIAIGAVGLGAGVGVANFRNDTTASVGEGSMLRTTSDGVVSVSANLNENLDSLGFAGTGGVVAVDAAVAVLESDSSVTASLEDEVAIERAGDVRVEANDERTLRAETTGVSVGLVAAGASVTTARIGGSTTASIGNQVVIGQAAGDAVGALHVLADASHSATATALAVKGGLGLAASGTVATATIEPTLSASIGTDTQITVSTDVVVDANVATAARAEATGINVSLGGSVGASVARAKVSPKVSATVGKRSAIDAGTFSLGAHQRVPGSGRSAYASASGAAGGLLLGANASSSLADNQAKVSAKLDDDSTLTVRDTATVQTDNDNAQLAHVSGVSIGFIAAGANSATASSDTESHALLGDGVEVSGGRFSVLANGHSFNHAHGVAGAGGAVSAPFSASYTSTTSSTIAQTGSRISQDQANDPGAIDVDTLVVSAVQVAEFDSWMRNTNASLIGASGAKTDNFARASTIARIGDTGWIKADAVTLDASTTLSKGAPAGLLTGSNIARPAWNVESSSGGLADFPAAGSSTVLLANTLAEVGAGAIIEPRDPGASDPGIRIDARNIVNATDRVTMASGGAVSAASGASQITTLCPAGHDSCTEGENLDSSVRVGNDAELLSEGDISAGSRTTANLSTQTAVDVYGLVGVAPEGSSVSVYVGSNRVEIGKATLYSGQDIQLSAGSGSTGIMNALSASARSDVFNNTVIPVNKDPVADAFVTSNSAVTIASGADLAAVRNIALYADKGNASASGVGIGKDIYRETLAAIASWFSNLFGGGDVSFETRTGRSVVTQDSAVDIHGTVRVGVERRQSLHIGYDGSAIEQTDGISILSSQTKGIYADILDRIEALKALIRDYAVDASDTSSDAAIAVAAYQSEINFLEHKLYEMGFGGNPDEPGFNSANPRQMAEDKLEGLDAQIAGLETERTQLEAEKTTIETEVDTLNQPLIADNDSRTAQNITLNGEIDAIDADIAALDPDDASYDDDLAALQAQKSDKADLKRVNDQQISSNNVQITTNEAPLSAKIVEISAVNTRISEQTDTRAKIQGGIDDGTYGDASGTGLQAKFLQISDSVARLGDIHVRGNRLTGTGVLDAPGDASITITNEGPSFLTLGKLMIASDAGGRLYFNGVEVHDKNGIAAINRGAGVAAFSSITTADAGSPAPAIVVQNRFNPLNQADADRAIGAGVAPVAPDIVLKGAITNLRGSVAISSEAGGIRLEETASISANSVEVEALNGDFVQSYTNSFKHVATSPLREVDNNGRKNIVLDTSGSGSIVANGSVLLAARYLNINGTIQSGIPEWGVSVPDGAKVRLPDGSRVDFDTARDFYNTLSPADQAQLGAEYFEVVDASVSGLAPAQWGDWTRITVNYNARDDRLELAGAQVQGGYIELFGQIFNTKDGGGKLRVLDGYGQVSVRNDTGKTLWVNTVDAGRGAQGRIVITDIAVDAGGNTVIGAPQTFTRSTGEARTGVAAYTPVTDLRYVLSTGYDSARTDEYLYSQNGWFGITAAPIQDQYKVGTTSNTDDPLLQGEFLRVQPVADTNTFQRNEETVQVSQAVSAGASWKKCNWWTLCANATYYQQYFVATGTKTTVTGSVRADHPIGIEYIGFDAGRIDIDSVGDVVLNGSLNNRSGNTTVDTDGSLSQHNLSAILSGSTIDLSAGTGIGSVNLDGSPLQAVQLRQLEGGVVNADTATGSIYLEQKVGDLNVGRIGAAGVDKVILESARDILAHDANALVQARRIDLIADNGRIGTLDDAGNGDALRISTGDTNSLDPDVLARHGLSARARSNINLSNVADADPASAGTYSGDLLLIGVESLGGDIRIQTSGSAIDNNPYATVDTRTEDELAALWDELRLRKLTDPDPNDGVLVGSDAKAQQAVDAFANGRSNNYRLYWQLRGRQADAGASYDPNYQYVLTSTERRALEDSGMGASDIDAFAANRSAQYQQLHAEVGGLTASFDDDYRYLATDADKDSITRGASWTEAQLLLSVGAGLLKEVTDTVTTIQEPNVSGRKVTLIVGQDVGAYGPDYVIDTTAGIENLSKAERAALAATERGDAEVDDEENPRIVTLRQPQPINVAVDDRTGALSASASGRVFIGSEQDLRIDRITAGDEVRIKVAGALLNAASTPNAVNVSSGGRLILEAASGGIGGTLDADHVFLTPFGIQLTAPDAGLIARAGSDIWLAADSGLFVDTVFSIGNVRLDARGSILDFQLTEQTLDPELNILARKVALSSATGMIGSPGNALDVAVSNEDGEISARTASFGQGVYLNGPQGEFFNIASVASGDAVALSSATFMFINGRVSGPGPISLVAGASMVLTPFADVHATTLGVFLQAGDLLMEESDDGADAAQIRVDVGTIDLRTVGYQAEPNKPRTAGDAVITGIYTGNPTESAILITALGSVFDGGDKRLDIIANTAPGATLTINAGGQIGGNPLDIDVLNFNASAGGLLHIDAADSLVMGDIRAEREIEISSQGSITANSVVSTHDDVSLDARGGDLTVGQVGGRDVTLGARNALAVSRIDVARNVALGGDSINAAIFGSDVTPITGALTGYGGRPASSMNVTLSAAGGFHFDTVASLFGNLHVPIGSLAIDHFFVGDRMVVTNPQTRLLIDQHNFALQGYDVQLFSGQSAFNLNLDRNLVNTGAFVIDRRASHEVLGPNGPVLSVVEYSEQALAGLHLAPRASAEAQEDEEESPVSIGANPVAVTMDGEE
ncbi:MAG TPA: leukotoxin LktA family filamentous adhesin [Thauera sp.]|nr:leukotoxin LktA family filamentous adhesin [Thauera sp.]